MIVMGAGTGGTMTGIGRKMKQLNPNIQVSVEQTDQIKQPITRNSLFSHHKNEKKEMGKRTNRPKQELFEGTPKNAKTVFTT